MHVISTPLLHSTEEDVREGKVNIKSFYLMRCAQVSGDSSNEKLIAILNTALVNIT